LRSLQEETGTAVLLITHDLGIVPELCTRVMVMYAGQIVEEARAERLFDAPAHPYTQGLLASMPRLDDVPGRLPAIPGVVPSALAWPAGCRFHDRCIHAWQRCAAEAPVLAPAEAQASARCHLLSEPHRRVATMAIPS
jgi:oligopeptide/dipeptide ABC transporter ATP-binding protein